MKKIDYWSALIIFMLILTLIALILFVASSPIKYLIVLTLLSAFSFGTPYLIYKVWNYIADKVNKSNSHDTI
jgi:hypothetical protein